MAVTTVPDPLLPLGADAIAALREFLDGEHAAPRELARQALLGLDLELADKP